MSTAPPAVARPASTVAVLRDAATGGIEAYLLRRPSASTFAPDAYVFPGGVVDAADGAADVLASAPGFDMAAAAVPMGLTGDDDALHRCAGHLVAALREVFEETGILLGCGNDGSPLGAADAARLSAARAELLAGGDFARILGRHDLWVQPDRLTYVAHLVTPPQWPRRYDARFFLARAAIGQVPAAHPKEASDAGWHAVAEVVEAEAAGGLRLMPPTRLVCSLLAEHGDVESALAEMGAHPLDMSP